MAKQDLRKMKAQKNIVNKEAVDQAEKMLGKELNISDKEMANIDLMADMAKQYEGKSEDELLKELLHVTEQGRQDGTLNNEMMETFYRSMAPMMSAEQKRKLDSIMRMIKK